MEYRIRILTGLLLCALAYNYAHIIHLIDASLTCVANPFLHGIHFCISPLTRWRQRRVAYKELIKLLEKTESERRSLLAELVATKSTCHYQAETAELTTFATRYSTDRAHLAQILQYEQSPQTHMMWVDKGTFHGIERDMVAVAYNCLLGRVTEVYPMMSAVMLSTDQLSKIPATCIESGTKGILSGTNIVERAELSYVSHLENIAPNELIISSGEGFIYPRGFALGRVISHEVNKNGLHYDIMVEPCISPRDISHCYLLQKGTEYIANEETPPTKDYTVKRTQKTEISAEALSIIDEASHLEQSNSEIDDQQQQSQTNE